VQQETQKELLQRIANDERRPVNERDAARRELNVNQPAPSQRRYGRNANVPMTDADRDADLLMFFKLFSDPMLTTKDIAEIESSLDLKTQQILAAFDHAVLGLFHNSAAALPLLVELHAKTASQLVRVKAVGTIRAIAVCSHDPEVRRQAQEFLTDVKSSHEPR
jgi:hypothetical protein